MMLAREIPAVRAALVRTGHVSAEAPFAIGLRLSDRAARELLTGGAIGKFRGWLEQSGFYVFTLNGFPFGSFHGARVKEKVFQPDWASPERVEYTQNLFRVLAEIAPKNAAASVSTLPGSHKSFHADDREISRNLTAFAKWLDDFSDRHGRDFHLGLEPEPLGHFENTEETLRFFRLLGNDGAVRRRIGVNYDACHFAIEFDGAAESLNALHRAGIRISKIHLSNALRFDPRDATALSAIAAFDEPTYFHQTIVRDVAGKLTRFSDLPEFLAAGAPTENPAEARVHFHIPLDAEPAPPLRSTRAQTEEVLAWHRKNPGTCSHFEIETYTWAVLPENFRRTVTEQIAAEYRWVLPRMIAGK